jgi:hypothetical protein
MCDERDSPRCSRCKGAYYCNKGSQKRDWRTHKLLCEDFSSFDVSTRPSANHFRAIVFPVDEEKPKLIWFSLDEH